MRKGTGAALVFTAALLVFGLLNWDSSTPSLSWSQAPRSLGRDTRLVLEVADEGRGLEALEAVLIKDGSEQVLVSESYGGGWPWQQGVFERRIAFSAGTSFEESFMEEGPFSIRVSARDHSNFWLWSRSVEQERSFALDLTPPRIDAVTTRHSIRHGGSESVVYRVSEDAVESGVKVGERRFRGYLLEGSGREYICIFALAATDPVSSAIALWARDGAGNEGEGFFRTSVTPVNFRTLNINLSDAFLDRVIPGIVARSPEVERRESLLDTYLAINGELRNTNNRRMEEIGGRSGERKLWSGPFVQLSRSQVQSAFADRRRYLYRGDLVDEQMHLGFDLASVARSPVESANRGVVVFAGYLGIYGNCVIVDHGLGVMSLYGHLSDVAVEVGDQVDSGQSLGRTGETGLAGGDHLHFGVLVRGVPVNPLEWWDARWLEEHVTSRLEPARYSLP